MSDWIGYIAAFLTTVSFLPQAIKTIKTKDTSGISLMMYVLFAIGVLLWFFYGIMLKEIPIIAANGLTFLSASTILWIKIRNEFIK